MKGSRSSIETPANARRTGKPSPSKPRGEVVTERTGRSAVCRASSAVIRGRAMLGGAVTAGISEFKTKHGAELFRVSGLGRLKRLFIFCPNFVAAVGAPLAHQIVQHAHWSLAEHDLVERVIHGEFQVGAL